MMTITPQPHKATAPLRTHITYCTLLPIVVIDLRVNVEPRQGKTIENTAFLGTAAHATHILFLHVHFI